MQQSNIVAKINSLLAAKGISKQEFYRSCGISSASYSLWNTGKTKPRMRNLETIASFLDVDVSFLLDDSKTTYDKKEKPSTENGERLDYSDMELLEAIRKADAKDLKAIRVILGIE